MRFSILSSGSKQNCFYIETEKSAILIDSGISYKMLDKFLEMIQRHPSKIKGLFITHEHLDHTRGLCSIARNLSLPVYMNEKSKSAIKLQIHNHKNLMADEAIEMDDLVISPFCVNHDAANTYGFKITHQQKSLFIASDIGSFDEKMVERSASCDAIAIESNYDPGMLENSFYPDYLKERIAGQNGHLSNEDAITFLRKSLSNKTRNVFFLHLSENNNSPSLVSKMIQKNLASTYPHVGFTISHREKPTPLIEI
jgi:phosphoribosyl 1,2-cyclic phosphodiesterase